MSNKPKVAVILSGSGVYDGSEIQESVLSLLALDMAGASSFCFAPDKLQHHVVNHLDGSEMNEKRNVLIESARIARGEIEPLSSLNSSNFHGLLLPGGFGAAKNLSQWAFAGSQGTINPLVEKAIIDFHAQGKPIAALCMGPTLIAKALSGQKLGQKLTVGSIHSPSPYNIVK